MHKVNSMVVKYKSDIWLFPPIAHPGFQDGDASGSGGWERLEIHKALRECGGARDTSALIIFSLTTQLIRMYEER